VAETARPEVHANPDATLLVREHIDVVISSPDSAELAARFLAKNAFDLGWKRFPGRVLEECVGIWRIA
jgi:hypothetical protein